MKRRLFALLLAVVMVLGLSAPALGEAAPAEETAVPTETEEAAVVTEETAGETEEPAGETEESVEPTEAPADETAEEPAGSAEEQGEPAPLAAEAPIKVYIQGDAEALVLTQMDGTPFNSGDTVPYDANYSGCPLLVQSLAEHYYVWGSDNGVDAVDNQIANSGLLCMYDLNDDGAVTVVVKEHDHVQVTIINNTSAAVTLTRMDGTPFKSGDKVYATELPDESYRPVLLVKNGSEVVPGLRFVVDSEGGTMYAGYDTENGIVNVFDYNGDDYISMTIDLAPSFQIKLAGETDKLKSLTHLDEPVKDGDIIYAYYSEQDYAAATLDAELVEGYYIESEGYYGSEDDYIYAFFQGDNVNATVSVSDYDGDGVVTITVAKRPAAKLTITGAADKVTFTDLAGDPVKSGDMIYADGRLNIELASGYGIPTGNYYSYYYINDGEFYVDAPDGAEIVVQVMPYVTLNVEGTGVLDVVSYTYGGEVQPGGQILAGESYYVSVKSGYTIEVTGGSAKQDNYTLDDQTGEITYGYLMIPDGSGPVTVKGVAGTEQGPTAIKIQYVDADGAISNENAKYCLPGGEFYLRVKDGYTISVEGGSAYLDSSGYEDENGTFWIYFCVSVDEGATAVTVTSSKLTGGAVLKVNGSKDGLLEDDPFGGEGLFCVDGTKLPNGSGLVLVKSGYTITGVQGGKAQSFQLLSDYSKPGQGEIYAMYYVEATASEVTLTVSPAAPNRWVKVNVVNNYEDIVYTDVSCAADQDGNWWLAVSPNNPDEFDLVANMIIFDSNIVIDTAITDYTMIGQGCSLTQMEANLSWSQYGVDVDDGVEEITITVVKNDLQLDLEVKVPDKPAEGVPGVPDKAAAEKKLMDKASAVVEAALQGETPAGVSKADAAAIAQAAAEGKTITTQLEVMAVTAPADAAALQAVAGEDTITQYLDIQIVVLADGEQVGRITETDQMMDFSVVLSDEELASGVIFYVIRAHDGATAVLNARLEGNVLSFSSNKFSTFAVANSNDISFADVEAIADQTWTGSEIKPAVKVTVNGTKTLTEGVDYTISYKSNVDAGTATVVITGIGSYSGTKEVTFKIVTPAPAETAKPAGTTKPADIPATGDETPLALYAGMLALCLGGLVLVLSRKKRTEK